MAQSRSLTGKFVATVPEPAAPPRRAGSPAAVPGAVGDEVGALEAELRAVQREREKLRAEKEERVAAHVARMDELVRVRAGAVARAEEVRHLRACVFAAAALR